MSLAERQSFAQVWLRMSEIWLGAPPTHKPRQEMPVVISGSTIGACPDSGAEENFIAEQLASSLALAIEAIPENHKQFRIGNGKTICSIGKINTTCAFPGEEDVHINCTLQVIKGLSVPLILGSLFLDSTQTLSSNRHRLQDQPIYSTALPVVNFIESLNNPKRRLACQVDGLRVLANADTGSDLDLISEAYAKSRGFKMFEGVQRTLQLADSSTTCTNGLVSETLSLEDGRQFFTLFHVLPGLTCDVLLGEETLNAIEAFTLLENSFVDVPSDRECTEINIVYVRRAHICCLPRSIWRKKDEIQDQEPPNSPHDTTPAELRREDSAVLGSGYTASGVLRVPQPKSDEPADITRKS